MRPALLALAALLPLSAFAADPPPKADPPKADKPADKPKAEAKFEVPYRLTDTKHVHVRVKLNGKGPFNFILDTGAPAVFVSKAVAKKVGLEEDKKGWVGFDSFAVEGGLKVDKARARVADLYQLDGMNSMGLAGVELHGIIGYEALARYRVTYDFTADKLTFEPLDFDPPVIQPGKKGNSQGGLDVLGPVMKTMASLMGVTPNFEVKPGGFVGFELEEKGKKVFVKAVYKNSPAEAAGLKAGDRLDEIKGNSIDGMNDVARAFGKAGVGDGVKVTVERGGESKTVTVKLGGGL